MSVFSTRVRELRTLKNVTQKQAASGAGVSERTYQNYELGTMDANLTNAGKLADYFNVSIDYLVGRTDNPKIR